MGIADYLLKPVKYEDLLASTRRVFAQSGTRQQLIVEHGVDRQSPTNKFPDIIGHSEPMLEVLEIIDRVAETDTNILLTRESDTGKDVVSRTGKRVRLNRESGYRVLQDIRD